MDNWGYVPHPAETEAFSATLSPRYQDQVGRLMADDDNSDALNYRAIVACLLETQQFQYLTQIEGIWRLKSMNQGPVGSCVGFGTEVGTTTTASCDKIVRRQAENLPARIAPEWCYGASREIVGDLGGGDGSYGSAAAKAISQWGTVLQQVYGTVDLRNYDPQRCRSWASRGCPANVKEAAATHKMESCVRVDTPEKAWSLIGNGYGINQCSNVGWKGNRDNDGAIRQSGSWGHSMGISSRRTTANGRKLFLVHQSWGDNWTGGPYWEDQPLGSFWADFDSVGTALSQGDSFSYSGYDGFVTSKMDWNNWTPASWN